MPRKRTLTATLALAMGLLVVGSAPASAQRPDLSRLSNDDQALLATMILSWLTDEELHWHMNINHNDARSFFHGHRAYIQRLERYLIQKDQRRFVPLPKWNPGAPVPETFRTVRFDQRPLENHEIGMPIPMAFQGPPLQQFRNLGELFEAIKPYHDAVHQRVGGAMADVMTAPGAPLFFCWHAALDDCFGEWAARTGYRIPISFEQEFPDKGGHAGHGEHGAGSDPDHGCICGPKCKCGPGCRCPKRTGWNPKPQFPPPVYAPAPPVYNQPPVYGPVEYVPPYKPAPAPYYPPPTPKPNCPTGYDKPWGGYGGQGGFGGYQSGYGGGFSGGNFGPAWRGAQWSYRP